MKQGILFWIRLYKLDIDIIVWILKCGGAQCCFKNEKIVHSTWVSLHWPLMLPKNIIRYPNPKFKYIALILQLFRTLCAVKY